MLRGFRHTLFLLLQIGVLLSAGVALAIRPDAWIAIAICTAGSLIASLICERIASRYLRRTLGRLRRAADDIGRGNSAATLEAHPGDDFYKLVNAVNVVAHRLADASREEARLQDELRRRERLAFLGELAATVAHEVNNPLDGVQNCARILRRSLDDPRRSQQMLDLIDGGLERIELIVRRLLTLAREHVIRPVEGRIRDVLESALQMTADKLKQSGVRVAREYGDCDDRVMLDAPLLEQAFQNLIRNAADSMSGDGEITITLRDERPRHANAPGPPMLAIDICDRGAGIPPQVLPHIFEPFFTTKEGGKGTGLGLPIAARVVDAHRGSIEVSAREGGGSVFTVRLPALVAAPAAVAKQPALAAAGQNE